MKRKVNTKQAQSGRKQGEDWAKKIKEGAIKFLDRRKHTTTENIRLGVIVSAVVLFIGILCPMLGVNMKFSMVDGSSTDGNSETVIFQPNSDIINISAGDFVFHKPLRDFALFGQKIGEMEIMGVNLYDLLTTPFPDFSGLKDVEAFLSSGTLSFLTDENFRKFCLENLGELGASLVEIGEVINNVATDVGEVLGGVNNVLTELNTASNNVRNGIAAAEGALNAVDIGFALVFLVILVAVLMLIFRKGPNYFSAVTLTIFSAIFLIIGVAVLIINGIIAGAISAGMTELNASVNSLLDGAVPGASVLLAQLISASQVSFVLSVTIYCGVGWWLMTIALVVMTVLAYVRARIVKRQIKEAETAKIEERIVEKAKKETAQETKK